MQTMSMLCSLAEREKKVGGEREGVKESWETANRTFTASETETEAEGEAKDEAETKADAKEAQTG